VRAPAQQNAEVCLRLVMQGPVIVAVQEAMRVDVEETIPRDDKPAEQVGSFSAPITKSGEQQRDAPDVCTAPHTDSEIIC
jgi:hypothetical protein